MNDSKSALGLEDFGPFKNLSTTSRSVLRRGARQQTYPKSRVVLSKGERVSGAFVVLRGRLRVYTLSTDGKEATLYFIEPGETCVLALNCIFNDLLYPAWVEVEAATIVARVPGEVWRVLFETEPAVRQVTIQAFSTLVFRLMNELETLHAQQLDRRLAGFLLLHASGDAVVNITQQKLASHLGTTREVVARVLRQLAAQKLVRTGRHRITIQDPKRLAAWLRSDPMARGSKLR